MLELVLTKADLAGTYVVDDVTVVDNGHSPKKAYTLKNPDVLDANGVTRTLAAIGVLDNYEDGVEVSYISYVEDGVIHPIVVTPGNTVKTIKTRLEGIIKETTEPLNVATIRLTRSDCERVKLHNGKPMWEKITNAEEVLGFTLTTLAGSKFSASIPEYLRMPLFQTHLGVIGLAATALTIEALSAIPENVLIDGVHFDLPDTELDKVTLLPDWFYIGVYHPVRASELMVFLDGYLHMFTPHAVSTAEREQETKIKETINELLKDWE
nr:MAG TPA: hypothetical protein [Caudoviricetes sp.]